MHGVKKPATPPPEGRPGLRERVARLVGWPAAQVRWVAEQVKKRLEASNQVARARYARARTRNTARSIEGGPPSSRG
jgi:hypothetical protein